MPKQETNKTATTEEKKTFKNFSFDEMRILYAEGTKKDHLDCKEYISSFFCPTTAGTHVLFENGKPTIIQNDTFSLVYSQRFEEDIQKWYKKKTTPKRLIADITKPMMGVDFINLSGLLKHKPKPYKKFESKTKERLQIMLDYIKEIWANGNKDVYEYLLNWFSEMVKGKKNKSCIYAKGEEGIGKSTLIDFIRDYVIGRDLYCKGKADHLKGQHNLQLLGKILVVFEELQFFSDKEWKAIDSEIKDLITDDVAQYTDKFEKRFMAENNNNYIVACNFNSIKGANGRRYVVLDINPSRMNDFKYFAHIRDSCFNDEVGHAFYCYLLERDTSEFNSGDIPVTQAKKDLCADLLHPHEKFLKFNYLLKEKCLNIKVKDLFEQYQAYCEVKKLPYHSSLQKFSQSMRELGLDYKKSNGYNLYKYTLEKIKDVATKKKWSHDLDADELNDEFDEEDYDIPIAKRIESMELQKYGIEMRILQLKDEQKNGKEKTVTQETFKTKESKEEIKVDDEEEEEKPKKKAKKETKPKKKAEASNVDMLDMLANS
jgi:hypothetical protein